MAKRLVANEELPSLKTSAEEFTNIDGNTTWYSMNGIKAKRRRRVKQDVDLVLKNPNLKTLGQPHDEVLNTAHPRYKHYKASEDRIILKDGLLFRRHFGETDIAKHYQILIPKHLPNEVLWSLHGEIGKHPGITKTITASREKKLFPKMVQMMRE